MLCGSEIVTSKSSFKYSSFVFTVLHAFPLFYLKKGFIFINIYRHTCLLWWFPFSVMPFPGDRREKVLHVFNMCWFITHIISGTLKEIQKQRMVEVWRHVWRFSCPTPPAQAGASRADFPGLGSHGFWISSRMEIFSRLNCPSSLSLLS